MEHPGFFAKAGPFTLAEVAKATGAEVTVEGERRVDDIRPLLEAAPSQLSFFDNRKYLPQLLETQAGACLIAPQFVDRMPQGTVALVTKQPYRAFAAALRCSIRTPCARKRPPRARPSIDPTAGLEEGVEIEPGAIVGPRGAHRARSRPSLPARDRLSRDHRARLLCRARASVTHALVGDRVILHSGVRIGGDGFGFAMGPGGHLKVPQIGRVIIQDDVEIGANSAVDRGALKDTVIGEGTKIDNLVQIGHNVVIGRHCVIVGQVGIAGSAELGDFVVMGGHRAPSVTSRSATAPRSPAAHTPRTTCRPEPRRNAGAPVQAMGSRAGTGHAPSIGKGAPATMRRMAPAGPSMMRANALGLLRTEMELKEDG